MRVMQKLAELSALPIIAMAAVLLLGPYGWLVPNWLIADDKIAHITGVALLACCGLVISRRHYALQRMTFAAFLLATYFESMQAVLPWRTFELTDIVANGVGALLGYTLIVLVLICLPRRFVEPERQDVPAPTV